MHRSLTDGIGNFTDWSKNGLRHLAGKKPGDANTNKEGHSKSMAIKACILSPTPSNGLERRMTLPVSVSSLAVYKYV